MVQTRSLGSPNKSPRRSTGHFLSVPFLSPSCPIFSLSPQPPCCSFVPIANHSLCGCAKGHSHLSHRKTVFLLLAWSPSSPPASQCQPEVPCDKHSGPSVGTTAWEGPLREVRPLGCWLTWPLSPQAAATPCLSFPGHTQPSEKPASLPYCPPSVTR